MSNMFKRQKMSKFQKPVRIFKTVNIYKTCDNGKMVLKKFLNVKTGERKKLKLKNTVKLFKNINM